LNTPTHYRWDGDLREVTGIGGNTELAARSAVSAAARHIDTLGDAAGDIVFARDGEGATVIAVSDQAQALDAIMRDAAKIFGGLTVGEYIGTIRVVQIYYALEPGPDRWARFLALRAPIDGVCRFCGQPIETVLTNWKERTRCQRCFQSRQFKPRGGAQC
jgi:hypothetical protein